MAGMGPEPGTQPGAGQLKGMGWSGLPAWGLSLAAYLFTLCPTVYVEGSGELIGATYLLGTPHPTGYPLFCLLGRLCALLLPLGSPAYQINLFSALGASLAVGLLSAFLQTRGLHPFIALGASLGFAFSATFWRQAVIAEVYGMAMLGVVLLLWAGVRSAEGGGERSWLGLAYIAGLGLTLHLSLVLLWPGIALLLWQQNRRCLHEGRLLGKGLGFFALGLSPVIYLILRNGEGEAFHWGTINTASQWWDHLSGTLYRDSFFSLPAAAMLLNLMRWAQQLLTEFHPLLVPLALWGVWAGFGRDRNLWWLVISALGCNLAVALNYHRDPNGIGVFFLLSILAAAFFLAWGIQDLAEQWGNKGRRPLVYALGAAVVLVVFGTHYAGADRRDNYLAHRYGSDILNSLPERAILMAEGDDAAFILDYLQRLEGLRLDVTLYNRMGRGRDLLKGGELNLEPGQQSKLRAEREAQLIAQQDRPVFYLYARRLPVEGYRLAPAGLCYRVWPAGQLQPPDALGLGPAMENATGAGGDQDPWIRKIQSNYAFMCGEHLLAQGDTSAALDVYREAARIAHDSRSTRFNVALMMLRNNRLDEAWEQGIAAADLDPWNLEVPKLLAQIRIRQGRRSEAEALLKKADQLGGQP